MSLDPKRAAKAAAAQPAAEVDYLDALISETKKRGVAADHAKDLIGSILEDAMKGTIVWDKSVVRTIKRAIEALDEAVSRQVAAIVHAKEFQDLEGAWRGLHHLVHNAETGSDTNLYIKLLNVSKRELYKDLSSASDHDQSELFKKVYESEFGTPGGTPYGALVGAYEFSADPEDVQLLEKVSNVAAAAFCPFVSAADPKLLDLSSHTEMPRVRDLKQTFTGKQYTQWRSFRESEDARFVTLTLPRVLARLPYGQKGITLDDGEFRFEELQVGKDGVSGVTDHRAYCWMNSAFVYAGRLADSYVRTGFCTRIRGAENGGKVEGLPVHVFKSDDGDLDAKYPTEIAITDRREMELSQSGFIPLCHYKNTDYAVFFGAQTVQKARKYTGKDGDAATANAEIMARMPYVMASSRIAHYLKVMGRDMIGRAMEAEDVQSHLNAWIAQYVAADKPKDEETRAKFPLKEARIEVRADPASPGRYNAIAWLRPWFQMEELNSSVRMVASIPQPKE